MDFEYRVSVNVATKTDMYVLSLEKWEELADICPDVTLALVEMLEPEKTWEEWILLKPKPTLGDAAVGGKRAKRANMKTWEGGLSPQVLQMRTRQTMENYRSLGADSNEQLPKINIDKYCKKVQERGHEVALHHQHHHFNQPSTRGVKKQRKLAKLH